MSNLSDTIAKWNEHESNRSIIRSKKVILNEINGKTIYVEVVDTDTNLVIKGHIKTYYYNPNKDEKEKANKFFIDKYGINIKSILAFGETNTISETFLQSFIPFVNIVIEEKDRSKPTVVRKIRSAKCYQQEDYDYANALHDKSTCGLVIHESCLSSWLCILEKLGKPTHTIIYGK